MSGGGGKWSDKSLLPVRRAEICNECQAEEDAMGY